MRLSLIAAALASAFALCECSSKMVIGYLPNWLYANYPVENIPYNKYTHLNYAFAILNNEDNLPSFTDDWAVESSLPKIIDMAHANNTKVLLSVGGWTGSKRFSPMVATPESRKKFIDWNLEFIQKYKTDGVDLDWEYPGRQAAGCNEFADDDADNYLLLLKELRASLDAKFPDQHKEISMAVHVKPFVKSGEPMNDVKEYVPYFDHVNLMTYDINGAWASTTGPNAPFRAEEGKGAPFSFVDSIRDWKAAGVPANKITAGLAFYGRTMKAKQDMAVQRSQFQSSEVGAPKGDSDDAHWQDPYCSLDPGGLSGIWKWTNLRKEGLLKDTITAGEGWQRNWDEVSQTPWLFNPSTKHFITYDDPQSLKIKVEHALCEDLAGVMIWDIHQDNGELIEAVGRIHDAAPASCERMITVEKNNLPDEVVEVDPETDIVGEQIDDLGNWVESPSTTAEIIKLAKETYSEIDEDEDWLSDGDEDSVESTESSLSSVETSLPAEETTLPVENTTLPAEETILSVEETSLSVEETSLSIENSSLSVEDTSLSAEETTSSVEETTSSVEETTEAGDESSLAPEVDQACSTEGQQQCVDGGNTSEWLTCNFGVWLHQECVAGTVCNDNQDGSIYCDFPVASNALKAASFLDIVNGTLPSPSISVDSHAQASRIVPSHMSDHSPSQASTLPIPPNASAIVSEDGAHQVARKQAKLAVELPLENAQVI